MNQLGLLRFNELDNKKVIDIIGVGLKYLPHHRKKINQNQYDDFDLKYPERYEYGYNVLRGIEVKVSKSDFKNGYICTGCNYNYVLTPMKLISKSIIPRGVGLIEFNRYKFNVVENEGKNFHQKRPYKITGLRVVKRPIYRNIPPFHIDHVIAEIANRTKTNHQEKTFNLILDSMDDPRLVYTLR